MKKMILIFVIPFLSCRTDNTDTHWLNNLKSPVVVIGRGSALFGDCIITVRDGGGNITKQIDNGLCSTHIGDTLKY